MSDYLSRRTMVGDEHACREFDCRVWDLYDEYRRHDGQRTGWDDGGPIQPDRFSLDRYLIEAAFSVLHEERKEREDLARSARHLALWALQATPEKNAQVAATFAVQVMYDRIYRGLIRAYLGATRPTRWWWTTGHAPRQHCQGAADEFVPPILGKEITSLQKTPVPDGNLLWEPEWAIRRSYTRQMDCLRPPLLAVRLAAHLIEQNNYNQATKVLAIELGHSVGPQALSIWLPRTEIHTWSMVFDPRMPPGIPEGEADAVVLGIPTLRRLLYTSKMADPDIQVDGRVVNRFWERLRDLDPLGHVEVLVEAAGSFLKLGGVLAVIGAVEEGEHHRAVKVIETTPRYKALTAGKPVQVAHRKMPWCPYWVLPPEDRLVSAYRRVR
jgi:hypothetical protein